MVFDTQQPDRQGGPGDEDEDEDEEPGEKWANPDEYYSVKRVHSVLDLHQDT